MNLDFDFMIQDIPIVFQALPVTLWLTVCSMILAILFAVLFGSVILKNIPVLKPIVLVVNTFVKGIPLVVQLLFCYYTVPILLQALDGVAGFVYDPKNIPYFGAAVFALGINFGAYITDVVVTSMRAVEKGQMEACVSMGMTKAQGLRKVVIPQAVVISVPDMSNYLIWMLKGTSIASIVNVSELLAEAKISAAAGYQYMEAYLVAALIYWIICIVIEWFTRKVYRSVGKYNFAR